ncbi:MAG: ribonuclease H-like domain-containing protein [Candidatus Magasanikbacteria bacterium]
MSDSKKEIVFDIETYGDINNKEELDVTVVSLYDYEEEQYESYDEDQLGDLWKKLEQADLLIGYNSKHFDVPVLNNFYAGDLSQIPHLDLLERIKESSGQRFKLDDIAKATLEGVEKSADGVKAMEWYEEGEIEKIKDYCEQDVKVTKDVYEFGRENKMLYHENLKGDLQPISVDFDFDYEEEDVQQQDSNINMTLPI